MKNGYFALAAIFILNCLKIIKFLSSPIHHLHFIDYVLVHPMAKQVSEIESSNAAEFPAGWSEMCQISQSFSPRLIQVSRQIHRVSGSRW